MAKSKEQIELTTVPALIVTPEKAPVVSGNFEQIEAYLTKWQKQVAKMKLTEEDMEQARLIKKEAAAYRNSLTKIQTEIKKAYFNDPKSIFEAKMGQLLGIVSAVESAADEVLAKEEQERLDDINQVIDAHVTKFQKQYNLDDERLARIERKKSYYNKTADEKERKDDIEAQFQALKKDQDACAANVRLITSVCKDEPRLNVQHWIDRLRHDDVATITEAIIAEKQRLQELDRQGKEAPCVEETECAVIEDEDEETEKTVVGVPNHIDFSSDFTDRTKTMKIEITYPCDLGDALSELFVHLRQYGIKVKRITEEDVF